MRKRKVLLILATSCLYIMCITSTAFAGTSKTLYATQQTWLYSSGHQTARYAVVPIDKNQKVTVGNMVVATEGTKQTYYYEVKNFGETLYIPKSKVTTKKPKSPIKVSYSFKELYVSKNVGIYSSPSFSAKKLEAKGNSLYTIGQTGNWYIVFNDGHFGYISKKSTAIKKAKTPSYVPIHISSKDYPSATVRKNMKNRLYLQYAQLPQYMREGLKQRNTEIYFKEQFPEKIERQGSLGYTESSPQKAVIYLKNKGIEFSFIHEAGHALTRHLLYSAGDVGYLLQEPRSMNVESYFASTIPEWTAESIRILVKDPEQLKREAPKTYLFLDEIVFGNK